MASATLQLSDRFPVGAALAAFPAALLGEGAKAPYGFAAVVGQVARAAVGVVGSDGTVDFDGLTSGVVYAATQAERGVVVEDLGDNEWKVTVANASGGTFTLSAGEDETSDLDFDADASDIQAAIRTATEGETETVTGSGGVFTVTLADASELTADGSSLTGTVTHTAFVRFSATTYAAPARIPHPYGS
jgi:hypothetical protein